MSTGLPIEIKSFMKSENYTSFCRLDIDNYKKTKTGGMVLKSRLSLKGTGQRTEKNVLIRFTRRTYIMPSVPLETKYHPSDVDILLIKRLITETSKHSFAVFLQHEFVAVSCRTFNREEIGRSKFNPMIGLGDHERRDEALYDDFETAKAREKRLAKEARVLEIQAKNVALGKKGKDPAATKAAKGMEASYYRVTCKGKCDYKVHQKNKHNAFSSS
ncbi:DNA topoisomerase 6 subunit B-like isoform X1 [Solanum tuberosum]|uniref:DNA topoisomerase 6 subunit B-like isoform X1 n=1 Tax=Solanum tuberosum TaxID=4113 RepID=UPI00073A5236|nr:PREDICTED: DNA topoisomerase 6 subunit B-like isoform X1 [Solanum tuberosum]XP_015160339.1 PREDICTED: DNA topoisomerase 6 subunit B-like isoform X1 [Solanum tuberosum]